MLRVRLPPDRSGRAHRAAHEPTMQRQPYPSRSTAQRLRQQRPAPPVWLSLTLALLPFLLIVLLSYPLLTASVSASLLTAAVATRGALDE